MIVTAAITTLLLPLGVWLVMSSATPRQDEQHVASSGLLALLIATAAFAAFGFAFMFGNASTVLPALSSLQAGARLSLPTPQPWSIVGLRGFLFQDVPFAGLALFLPYLALAQTCAVLVNSAIAQRTHALTQVALATASGGLAFGIAGHWMFGGGWLAMLGQNLGFGHGAVDIGGMATVGLVVGAFAIALLLTQPALSNIEVLPASPTASQPFRTLCGSLLILIGALAVVGGNPLMGAQNERMTLGFAVNLLAAASVAGLFAFVYTLFTSATHKASLMSTAQAMLAALIAISSAGGLLPVWSAVVLGVLAGGLATLGLFWVQTRLPQLFGQTRQLDTGASVILVTVFAPAVMSFLAAGLLANGAVGVGWNGVGLNSYLGVAQLGISGLLPVRSGLSDAGQFTAQVLGLLSITLLSLGVAYGLIRLLRISLTTMTLDETTLSTTATSLATARTAAVWASTQQTHPAAEPVYTTAAPPMPLLNPASASISHINPIEPMRGPVFPTGAEASTSFSDAVSAVNQPDPVVSSAQDAQMIQPEQVIASDMATDKGDTDATLPSRPPRAKPFVLEVAEESPAEEGLVERMRKLRRSRQPAQPVRARKIAYPTRVAGRRLIRPMVEDNTPKP